MIYAIRLCLKNGCSKFVQGLLVKITSFQCQMVEGRRNIYTVIGSLEDQIQWRSQSFDRKQLTNSRFSACAAKCRAKTPCKMLSNRPNFNHLQEI